MRVLLMRLGRWETFAPGVAEKLAGMPVNLGAEPDAPTVGKVKRAWVEGPEMWADLELDAAFLPHEVTVTASLLRPVKQ